MLSLLNNRTYRHLFAAQIVALLGTGLATVALGLLAFELAGDRAGTVLGTALAIKMLAYVAIAPIAAAFAERLPRRALLVALDLLRAAIAVLLPFVNEIWQVYVLIFLLQSASAAFTPTFQATIPDVLPDEDEYTRALSLSRLAYDLENLISPMLAAALLSVMHFHTLFAGTAMGFIASGLLVVSVRLPCPAPTFPGPIYERTTRGCRIYLATPRLRGLLAVNLAVAAAGAMVIVNTVVIVQGQWGLNQQSLALALSAFGGGSMAAALALPSLLATVSDRSAMLSGVLVMILALMAGTVVSSWSLLLPLWFALGLGYSAAQTPSGRLLKRSSRKEDRAALFAAQFALSHACWLVTYPLAGWLGATLGMTVSFVLLAAIATLGLIGALIVWPAADRNIIEHGHPKLSRDDPHWLDGAVSGAGQHSHAFIIDDLHQTWPREP
jgi:H+ antiporter protein